MADRTRADLLLGCIPKGRDHARKVRIISSLTGIPEREVQSIVEELRAEGHPIASAVHSPFGYYIPATRAEAEECLAQLESRLSAQGRTYRHLARAFAAYHRPEQTRLEWAR